MTRPGPCFFPPCLTSTGGLSNNDLKAGSSTGCGPSLLTAVLDICLHSGHLLNNGVAGFLHATLEATRKLCAKTERAGTLIMSVLGGYGVFEDCMDMH